MENVTTVRTSLNVIQMLGKEGKMDFTDIIAGILAGIGAVAVVLIIMAIAFFPISALVMVAWNLIASIFGAVTISYLQAMGVTLGLWFVGGIFKKNEWVKFNANQD